MDFTRVDAVGELKSDIATTSLEAKSHYNKISGTLESIILKLDGLHERYKFTGSQVESIDSRLKRLENMSAQSAKIYTEFKAHLDGVNAKLSEKNSKSHRMLALLEEQENRNKYVLDGYSSLNDRVERLENPI